MVGAALCLIAGCGTTADTETTPPKSSPSTPAPTEQVAVDVPDPQNLSVPAIGVSSTLVPLGLTADNQHEVPPLSQPEQAGWFQPGPEPGEVGAAIVLGHVNGNGQPGVFTNLDQMTTGETIKIDELTFVVYDVVRAPKDAFPTERVYGGVDAPELRLITCGGAFDKNTGNYLDNIIVFASLAVA